MATKTGHYSIAEHFIIWAFKAVHPSLVLCLFVKFPNESNFNTIWYVGDLPIESVQSISNSISRSKFGFNRIQSSEQYSKS